MQTSDNISSHVTNGSSKVFEYNIRSAVFWMDLWALYDVPTLESFLKEPFRSDWDHVEGSEEVIENVKTKEACHEICGKVLIVES